ncbi:MAG: hypothetical protein ACOYLB_04355 [Phototrophicaceae bacterium]
MLRRFWAWFNQLRSPHHDPLLQDPIMRYMLLPMKAGRTASGFTRYTRLIQSILLGLLLVANVIGFALEPNDTDTVMVLLAWGGALVSIFFFVIADAVTLFFTVSTLRHPLKDRTHYDLIQVSLVSPMHYTRMRFKLAELRAWRGVGVLWWMRWYGWLYGVVVAGRFIVQLVWERWLSMNDSFYSPSYGDDSLTYLLILVLTYGVIYSIMLLFEPFWRVKMLIALAGSLSVRIQNSLMVWLAVSSTYVLCLFLQGSLAAGITYLSIRFYSIMESILFRGYSLALSEATSYSNPFIEIPSLLFASIPPFLMIFAVRNLQNRLTLWRTHVTHQYIFRR